MALNKMKTLDTGASGSYWMISRVEIDRIEKYINVWTSLFKDQEFRFIPGSRPLEIMNFLIPAETYEEMLDENSKDVQLSKLYTQLKSMEPFKGAQDV